MRSLFTALLASTALVLGACGSDDDAGTAASTPATQPGAAASTPTSTPETTPLKSDSDVDVADGKCADVPPAEAKSADVAEPTGSLDTSKRWIVTLDTSCGSIRIELDPKNNPKTANAFASLTKAGFYDGLSFHRVVPGFVIQGGDPAGNGSSGPSGWQTVEAPPKDQKYTAGVVAMAKTGSDPDGASGSQFFIVTGDDVGLPAQYAVAGNVVKGQKIADLIADQGTEGADGPPKIPVVILSAKLTSE